MRISWDTLGVASGPNVVVADILKEANNEANLLQPETNSYVRRQEQKKAQYKIVSKDVSKYHRIIKDQLQPGPGETLVLGEFQKPSSAAQVVVADVPEVGLTRTEQKLQNIIAKLRKGRRAAAEALFPKAEGHSKIEAAVVERKLRTLMAEELREARRLKSIKSKAHHRRRRKAEDREQARLMERLLIEDPAAAENLREEWELKRAEARMMLGTKARREWAKMAKRFGGKDLERTINAAHMDAETFKQYLDKMSGKAAADRGDYDSSEHEDENDAEDEQKKGIWAMPFMKRARELRQIAAENNVNLGDDFDAGANALPDEGDRAQEFLAKKRREVPDANLQEAEPAGDVEPTEKDEEPRAGKRNVTAPSIEASAMAEDLDLMSFVTKPAKRVVAVANGQSLADAGKNDEDDDFNARFFTSKKLKASVEIQDASLSQEALVQMAFNVDGDEERRKFAERLEAEELAAVDATAATVAPTAMPGWGNWSAEGYEDPKVRAAREAREAEVKQAKAARLVELKKRGLVKVHPSACKPSDKYLINRVPRQYKSEGQYSAAMKQGVGDEFVAPVLSRVAVAPKQEVIRGRVLSALKAERSSSG